MEEGFDFVWRAYQRPFFRDSKGNKTYMDVGDYVPYLKSWKEGTAVPARRKKEPPAPLLPEQDDSLANIGQGTEVDSEKNADNIHNKMDEESTLGDEVCCDRSDSAAEADAIAVATPATLPDESMSLNHLMTSDPDPPAPKAKPKPKAKAKADAKPKAKPKPKSESSKSAKGRTKSVAGSDPGASSSSMVLEPPASHVLSDPYADEEGDDCPGIEKLFEDYVPEEHSDVAVDDPAPEAVRSPSSSSKPGELPASRRSEEVPKHDDKEHKPIDPKTSEKRSRGEAELRKEAKSVHHLLTHTPKNPFCPVCQRAKMYKPPSYKTAGIRSIKSDSFGEHLTCDYVIVYRDNEASIEGCRLALILKDVGTSFMHAYPSGRKSQDECYHALTYFVSNKDEVGTIYSDNALEITGAMKDIGWRHEQSKAYIHQSNALAERAIRATTEGTRSNLEQAGLSHCYWPHALEHACVCHNASNPRGIE